MFRNGMVHLFEPLFNGGESKEHIDKEHIKDFRYNML